MMQFGSYEQGCAIESPNIRLREISIIWLWLSAALVNESDSLR